MKAVLVRAIVHSHCSATCEEVDCRTSTMLVTLVKKGVREFYGMFACPAVPRTGRDIYLPDFAYCFKFHNLRRLETDSGSRKLQHHCCWVCR